MKILLLLLAASAPALADGKLLSVLELHNKLEGGDKKAVDASYLSDRIRAEVLDAKLGVQVMTRENMLVLLQSQGKSLENCEGECEVDTGRRLGADYVISGEVLRVGATLKATLKLHDTHTGTLLGAVSASGVDVEALDANLPGAVRRLVEPIAPAPAAPPLSTQVPSAPPVRATDAITMKVPAPPEGKWLLVTSDGSMLCQLPCTQRLARGTSYYAERDADRTEDRHRVSLPSTSSFATGRSVEAAYVPGRGSTTVAAVLGVSGLFVGALGVGFFAARSSYTDAELAAGSGPNTTVAGSMVAGGAAVAVIGLVLAIWTEHEHYEGKLSGGQAQASLLPDAIALHF